MEQPQPQPLITQGQALALSVCKHVKTTAPSLPGSTSSQTPAGRSSGPVGTASPWPLHWEGSHPGSEGRGRQPRSVPDGERARAQANPTPSGEARALTQGLQPSPRKGPSPDFRSNCLSARGKLGDADSPSQYLRPSSPLDFQDLEFQGLISAATKGCKGPAESHKAKEGSP